jgi:hypothetical protein
MSGPGVEFTELTGLPPDENCLHCHLPGVIDEWRKAHPGVSDQDVLIAVAQLLGELTGSAAYNTGHAACVSNITSGVLRIVANTALELVKAKLAADMAGRPS